jgi:hypothetical protein
MQRVAFVKAVLRLSERGKYSKNPSLASTAASCASTLAFVEPDLVLPLVVSQFHTAMDTVSAESQFVALVVRRLMTALQIGLSSIQVQSTHVTEVKHQNWLNQREHRCDSITPERWLKVSDLFIWRH